MLDHKLTNVFPNVYIALRIYLSMFGSSCEAERSFSALKRVKNCLRSNMGQLRLTSLTLLSVESELVEKLDFNDIINDFAHQKSRKVQL